MSTAVLISGQARTFRHCYPNQRWQVFRKLEDPWFFVSVADDAQAEDMEILRQDYEHVFIERVTQPILPEPENAAELVARAPYPIVSTPQAILRQFWHLKRVYEWYLVAGRVGIQHTFSAIVRIRPDLLFHSYATPPQKTLEDDMGCKRTCDIWHHECHSPWWSRWGGINDRFAIMGGKAALHYFNAYTAIPLLWAKGCPLHPESMLKAALELGNITSHDTLKALFSTVRLDGKLIKPDPQPWDHCPA